jgi:D-alanine-D-alanine ligase
MLSQVTPALVDAVRAHAGRVGVLMGGNSGEREISLKSGMAVLGGLRAAGINAAAIDWDGALMAPVDPQRYDRIFIALHGRGGEDGQIQAVLDLQGVPYTGSGVLGCALAMDKARAKLVWLGSGLPTPEFEVVDDASDVAALTRKLGLPLMIKPAREGSSLGISKVDFADDLGDAIINAQACDSQVLAERYIAGDEYTLAIVDGATLPMIKLETSRAFYDYDAKYVADDTRYVCPCGLSESAEDAAAQLGLRAFEVLDARGWGRVDFMCDASGKMWLIELNTVPGMTDHSLVPMAAQHAGMSFEDLVVTILASSMRPGELP